jgi:DNA-directed RNA polymerase subunit L
MNVNINGNCQFYITRTEEETLIHLPGAPGVQVIDDDKGTSIQVTAEDPTIGGILRDAITEIRKRFGVTIKRVEFVTYQDYHGSEHVVAVGEIKVEVVL